MSTRNSEKKTRHGDNQNEECSSRCNLARLDLENNSLSEEQVYETSLRVENKITGKRDDEIRKSENIILKALNSLSEMSPLKDQNGPCAQIVKLRFRSKLHRMD